MKHAKRDKLTTVDVNAALHLRNVEQLYGYAGDDPVRFQRAIGAKVSVRPTLLSLSLSCVAVRV